MTSPINQSRIPAIMPYTWDSWESTENTNPLIAEDCKACCSFSYSLITLRDTSCLPALSQLRTDMEHTAANVYSFLLNSFCLGSEKEEILPSPSIEPALPT